MGAYAEGIIDEIPVCPLHVEPFATEVEYRQEDDHLLVHTAEMLHAVYLYNRRDLFPGENMVDFLEWNYKHLLICESTLAHAAMLFTDQPGTRPPKTLVAMTYKEYSKAVKIKIGI